MSDELHLPAVQVPEKVDQSVERAAKWARDLEITDQGSLASATSIAATIKEAHDEAEQARVALVKPLNDHVKYINDTFRSRLTGLKGALDVVKGKIAAYAEQQEAERREAAERARADAEARAAAEALLKGEDPAEAQTPSVEVETGLRAATHAGSAHTAKVWDYEITDFKALCAAIGRDELPIDLVEPNRSKLRVMLNDPARRQVQLDQQERRPDANGLRFFQKTNVSVRRTS